MQAQLSCQLSSPDSVKSARSYLHHTTRLLPPIDPLRIDHNPLRAPSLTPLALSPHYSLITLFLHRRPQGISHLLVDIQMSPEELILEFQVQDAANSGYGAVAVEL